MIKKYWRVSLLFVFGLAVILFITEKIIDLGVKSSDYRHFYKVNLIVNKGVDPEIAVFGSSVGEVGINIPVLEKISGMSAYNFSIDGTRFMQYKGLIEEFNEQSDSCKIVVFAETFFSLEPINQLTEVDRYIAYIRNNNIYNSLVSIQPGLVRKIRYVPFYKFIVMNHTYYKASITGWMNILGLQKGTAQDSLKGYTPKNDFWDINLDEFNRNTKPIHIHINQDILKKYNLMLDELLKKGRQVVIIIPPIQSSAMQLFENFNEMQNAFSSLSRKGVYFIDYSGSAISPDKKYFYNNTHLNVEGSAKFTFQLAKDIKNVINKK